MDAQLIDKIANAVLYEGYILYPYRPSVKNRQRWTFGGIFPESYALTHDGSDPCTAQTQLLIEGPADATLRVRIRFLHLTDRIAGKIDPPLEHWPSDGEPQFQPVDCLQVGSAQYQSWQEATERHVDLPPIQLTDLINEAIIHDFKFSGQRDLQPLPSPPPPVHRPAASSVEPGRAGEGVRAEDSHEPDSSETQDQITGVLLRVQHPLKGQIELSAESLSSDLIKLTCRVTNRSDLPSPAHCDRTTAQMQSMASTHAILNLDGAQFISATDPPPQYKDAAEQCSNIGWWPVLVGAEPDRDTMLCSPIILYDYPQIAPESPGDLFDGGEIDEILTLRILTLSDEEKQAVANIDQRARAMLERTHSLDPAQLASLHGTMRNVRPVSQGGQT